MRVAPRRRKNCDKRFQREARKHFVRAASAGDKLLKFPAARLAPSRNRWLSRLVQTIPEPASPSCRGGEIVRWVGSMSADSHFICSACERGSPGNRQDETAHSSKA